MFCLQPLGDGRKKWKVAYTATAAILKNKFLVMQTQRRMTKRPRFESKDNYSIRKTTYATTYISFTSIFSYKGGMLNNRPHKSWILDY